MNIDRETKEVLSLADHVKAMLDSDGWKYAKGKFDERVMKLQNIHNLDLTDPTTLSQQLAARLLAVEYMKDWYLLDVVGFVEQQTSNSQELNTNNESYIQVK